MRLDGASRAHAGANRAFQRGRVRPFHVVACRQQTAGDGHWRPEHVGGASERGSALHRRVQHLRHHGGKRLRQRTERLPLNGLGHGVHAAFEPRPRPADDEGHQAGVLAEQFKEGVQALIDGSPTEEEIDDYLGQYSPLMQHPLVMH